MKEEDDAPNGGRCRRDGRAREGTVDPCSRHVFVITYRRGSKNEMGRGDGDGEGRVGRGARGRGMRGYCYHGRLGSGGLSWSIDRAEQLSDMPANVPFRSSNSMTRVSFWIIAMSIRPRVILGRSTLSSRAIFGF